MNTYAECMGYLVLVVRYKHLIYNSIPSNDTLGCLLPVVYYSQQQAQDTSCTKREVPAQIPGDTKV